MSIADTVVSGFLGRLLFRQATVTSTETLSPHFIRLILTGDALRGATWSPGDKLQVYLTSVGTRAYTPVRWDTSIGQTELLLYAHGDTPGVRWARSATVGTKAQLFGPRSSLAIANAGRSFVFGDETSIALALTQATTGTAVLEVTDARGIRDPVDSAGPAAVGEAHRAQAERSAPRRDDRRGGRGKKSPTRCPALLLRSCRRDSGGAPRAQAARHLVGRFQSEGLLGAGQSWNGLTDVQGAAGFTGASFHVGGSLSAGRPSSSSCG